MKELLEHLIEALREELKEYGEMLALLDQQQQMVTHRQSQDLLQSAASVNAQVEAIAAARGEREQRQRHIALQMELAENAPFATMIPHFPSQYRPLIEALVQENNELLVRVQQRARQNHLLLNRAVELMQRFIGSLFPGTPPATYNEMGRMPVAALPQRSMYDAIG